MNPDPQPCLPHIQIKLLGHCRLCRGSRFAAAAVRRRTARTSEAPCSLSQGCVSGLNLIRIELKSWIRIQAKIKA
jgi:hypothetical protein